LIAAGEVDNGKPPVPKSDAWAEPEPFRIRPTVGEYRGHPSQQALFHGPISVTKY
jgi:hypothetical protein